MLLAAAVGVNVAVSVGVAVNVAVGSGVGVLVKVAVGVSVGVMVGVSVGRGVGVSVGGISVKVAVGGGSVAVGWALPNAEHPEIDAAIIKNMMMKINLDDLFVWIEVWFMVLWSLRLPFLQLVL